MKRSRAVRRILMTSDAVGGVFTYVLDLARILDSQGIETILVNLGRRCTQAQRHQAESVSALTLLELELKLEWMDACWDDVDRAGQILLDLERIYRPDIVHLNGYAHGALPFEAPTVVVAHSCVYSWWDAVHAETPPEKYGTYRERVRAGLLGADAVVCVSEFMQRALAQHYGYHGEAHVIYNASDVVHEESQPREPWVLSAGRLWDEAKNLAALEACAAQVAWPIFAAGDERKPSYLAADATSNAARHVSLLGHLSRAELLSWLRRASIYALPARYEPFGLSVLEAALSGCALVLGDIPSLRELWQGAASFVAPDDAAGLAAALNELIDEPGKRAELAQRAGRRAKRFTFARMLRDYLDLYQALLEGRLAKTSRQPVSGGCRAF